MARTKASSAGLTRMFDKSTHHYTDSVGGILRKTGRYLLVYRHHRRSAWQYLFLRLPTSFLPEEDQGVFMTMVQLPAGATQMRTQQVLDQVDGLLPDERESER